MNQLRQLGTDPILKLIIKFSIPSIIGMFVNALYNIVDRIFIGQFAGEDALGGLTAAFPVMMLGFSLMTLVGVGGSALISIKFGEKKMEEAQQIYGNMLTLMVILSAVLITLGYLFLNPLLTLVGATPQIHGYASAYMRIVLSGIFFQFVAFSLSALVRVEGMPKLSMMTQLIGAITNIILDFIFIVLLDLNIYGAALGTLIAQFVSFAVLVWYYFIAKKSILRFKKEYLKLKGRIIKSILTVGSSNFVINFGASITASIFNASLVKYGGEAAIVSMGAINSLFSLVLMVLLGMQQGLGPIIGYNYGMEKYQRVKKALRTGIGLGFCFALIMTVVFEIWPYTFASLFIDPKSATMAACAYGMRIYFSALIVLPFSVIGTAYFQTTGQGIKSLILTISRQAGFLIPAILILPRIWGLTGVWLAAPVADFLALILTLVFLIVFKLPNKFEEETTADYELETIEE